MKQDSRSWKVPVAIVSIVIVLWVLSGILINVYSSAPGTFGDAFGAVNALFSGLAFAGIVYTILLQREELGLQRKELEATRQELKGQREVMAEQSLTQKRQRFEQTFFQLLTIHNDIVSSIDLHRQPDNLIVSTGRDCFRTFHEDLQAAWAKAKKQPSWTEQEKIKKTYMAVYNSRESDLGHYFRSLYNLVKYVSVSDVENKRVYTNLIRATLSSFELVVIFYNCLTDLGAKKFRPLVEEYSLLKNVNSFLLLNSDDHREMYNPSAYGQET